MVDVQEQQLVTFRELELGQSSTGANADVNKGLEDLNMESSASTGTGTDGAVVTVAPGVRGDQANEEPGKKLEPYLHLSSPPCNHSPQGLDQEEETKQAPEKIVSQISEHWAHAAAGPPTTANSGPAAMETEYFEDAKAQAPARAEAVHNMDMEMNTKMQDGAPYRSGKEVPRCDSENLDSSRDYGRREASLQGNSNPRHICKHCAKVFPSGRALGGHMRAHGSQEGLADGVLEKQQQLSALTGHHASHFFNSTDRGRDPALSVSVKQEGAPSAAYSKRSRSNGKGIEGGRRSPGERRSRHSNSSGKQQLREVSPKNLGEEIDGIKQEEDENAAAPMTEPEPSISSDDDDNNEGANEDGVTDGAANNVCNVCDREFDNSKQLNSHKKGLHSQLYGLRRNPKRSRRFMDQDFTAEAAAASLPAKKTSSTFTPDGNLHECSECGKRFQSWKALFGHMRCHPDRTWRGIRPPPKDGQQLHQQHQHQQGTSSAERQLTISRRKEVTLPSSAASQESDSESETEGRVGAEPAGHGKAAVASDNESDTESIERAYLHNVERQPSKPPFMTGKRSKRSHHIVRSLHSVTKTAAVPLITPPENDENYESAMGLMMLARKEGGKEFNWLGACAGAGGRTSSSEIVRQSGLESALSETERDDVDDQLEEENASDCEDDEYVQREDLLQHNNKGKGKLDASDNVSLCEENEEGGDDCEAAEQGAGSAKPKYICNTCKRVFKSHQALGGHRASHKKVKGCYARTNVNDGGPENPDEEMISEEFRSDDQLPTDLQDQSHSEGDEKERQFSAFSKEDSGEILNGNRNKSKGHTCTICGRVFNSGQALGGHKRCHYNTKEATSSEATSSTNNKSELPAAPAQHQGAGPQGKVYKGEVVQRGGPTRLDEIVHMPEKSLSEELTQPVAQARPVKEKFLDLNLPAPVNDDDMDLEAYEMPPANLLSPPPPKKLESKGTADFPSTTGMVKSSNLDAEPETGKPKDGGYFPLYPQSYPALVEENNQDLDGSQDAGFRGDEVDFSLRYVECSICHGHFGTVEALSNHEKTHASMMSSVSGLTPISA